MSNRFFLLSLGAVTIVSGGALGLIVTMVNPFRATTIQLMFFYSSLFFVLAALFAVVAFFVIRYLRITNSHLQSFALREGAIVGGLVVALVVLQSYRLMTLPVVIALIVLVGLIEFYAASALRFDGSMREPS